MLQVCTLSKGAAIWQQRSVRVARQRHQNGAPSSPARSLSARFQSLTLLLLQDKGSVTERSSVLKSRLKANQGHEHSIVLFVGFLHSDKLLLL